MTHPLTNGAGEDDAPPTPSPRHFGRGCEGRGRRLPGAVLSPTMNLRVRLVVMTIPSSTLVTTRVTA